MATRKASNPKETAAVKAKEIRAKQKALPGSRKPIPRLFFDIETVAAPNVEDYIGEPKIDKRIKDPEKIAAQREEKIEAMIESAPLDPDLGQIALISMQITGEEPRFIYVPQKKMTKKAADALGADVMVCDEAVALREFWKMFGMCSGRAIGYNVISFDFPFLMRRSFDLGVQPIIIPNLARYRIEPITDLFALLFNWDWKGSKSMKWVCARYGIEILEPEVEGSMVKDMTPEELVRYGKSDIWCTEQLFNKMNGYYFDLFKGPGI